MTLIVSQNIRFTHENELSIKNVTEVLLALDSLAKRAARISLKLEPRFERSEFSISLKRVESGSLDLEFVSKFIPDHVISKLTDDFKNMSTLEFTKKHRFLLLVLFGLLAAQGWQFATSVQGSQTPQIHIQSTTNNYYAAAKAQGFDPEKIQSAIELDVGREKRNLANDAMNLVRPFKADINAAIHMGEWGSLKIGPETLAEVPETIVEPLDYTDHKNVRIQIRATDRDSGKKGWMVILPDLPELSVKRIVLKVEDSIRLEDIAFKKEIVGHIAVFYRTNKAGNREVKWAELYHIVPD